MNTVKKHVGHGISQFEMSKIVLNNLKYFKLTPIGKLVLIVLVDCFNPENGSVVFPSMDFIAEKAGVGLTATKQAIKDLINEGLIIKTKRGKMQGNHNKYLLTPKIQNSACECPQNEFLNNVESQKTNLKKSENDFLKQSDSDRFYIEQKTENKKRTNNVVEISKKQEVTDSEILEQYAKEKGAQNVKAYVNALRISGAAAKVVEQYREKEGVSKYWKNQAVKTSELVQEYNSLKADEPTENFKALKAKLQELCKK